MMTRDWVMVVVTVLYGVIGGFVVIDAGLDFKLSRHIRKFFGE